MAIVTGDRYLDALFKFVEAHSSALLDGTLVLKLNPVGLHYVHSRLEQLQELESLLAGAPVDYLRAYISDLGDHRALEQLRRILRLLSSLKAVSVLPPPARDPTPVYLLPFGRLKVLELRGCDLSTSAARGLLELRHTLEKLICHNSTDALRHVFASRIVDIKDSPAWNKLSFVSCACNELVLMDESLQLLPSVETLDLSRNRFAKVDNLRRCTKLKHLDLGFNHLRTVASLTEVSCQIVKLVLRNNALTTLHGIENLKSVEGLDLSYNVISNFSELELLGSLSSLKNLWLEGNPVCCALWYRAQVFSCFTHPEELTLDERGISTRETWKRQIILASRQKQPAGYGFYSPAKDESEEGSFNTRRRKLCRLAFIEEEEQKSFFGSETFDQESISCDSSYLRRDENPVSDGEAEAVDLMTKIEIMKKERSGLWLREFRDWMDDTSEDRVDDSKFTGVSPVKENCRTSSSGHKHCGESSRYVPDSVQDSGDESSTNFLESDVSFTDTSIGFNSHHYFDSSGKATLESSMMDGNREAKPALRLARMDSEQKQLNLLPSTNMLTAQGADRMERKFSVTSLTAIDEIMESRSSSIHHGSPPHYQEDILHRRHNLEEEILQLSAESFSLASSDSDTSCDDDSCKFCAAIPGADQPRSRDSTNSSINDDHDVIPFCGGDNDIEEPGARKNSRSMLYYCSGPSSTAEVLKSDITKPFCMASALDNAGGDILDNIPSQCMDCMEKRKGKSKPSRRIISLPEGNLMRCNAELLSQKLNGVLESREVSANNRLVQPIFHGNGVHNSLDIDKEQTSALQINSVGNSHSKTRCGFPNLETDEFIKNYFDENVAEAGVSETCLQHMLGDCILHQASGHAEMREVAILRSSEHKLYIVLLDGSLDGTGNISRVVGCHRLEDISEVVVGIGLQILRVHITGNTPYLFITRTIDKSRRLLSLLQVCDSSETSNRCSIRRSLIELVWELENLNGSWEQVQVKLFEDHICGGLKMSIFQYSMLLFWHNGGDGGSWLSRSLFVTEGYVLVCIEDLSQFSSPGDDLSVSSPYFFLDSCCTICSILEMVIESKERRCVTLSLDCAESNKIDFLPLREKKKQFERMTSSRLTWKLKWFSEDAIFKFVALIKAIRLGITMSPLPIRCIP